MPFRSEAQRRYMFARHPEIAKRWAKEYGTPKGLPYHVPKKKRSKHRQKLLENYMKRTRG
jgi:hypothetical protein